MLRHSTETIVAGRKAVPGTIYAAQKLAEEIRDANHTATWVACNGKNTPDDGRTAARSITHKDADELLAALSSIVAAAFGPMLPTTFWVRHGQPAIDRYLKSHGIGVKAPEIPVLPNMSEPFTEPAPDKAPTPADNVVSFSPGVGIAEANADMRKKKW